MATAKAKAKVTARAKADLSVEEQALAAIKANAGHIFFVLVAVCLILIGAGMVEEAIRTTSMGLSYSDSMLWPYGTLVFGGMVLGGVFANLALARRKGHHG